MKTPKEWIPSDEELKLITFVINHCITIGDLWLRFMIFSKQNTNETTGDKIEKWQKEINRKEKRKVFLSKNQELFLKYPNIYNTIEKHNLNEIIFLKEFIKFFYEYLDKIPTLKNFLVNLEKMEAKSGEEIALITVREFLAPIVTKLTAKQTLTFSHFKIVENLILFLESRGEEGTTLAEKIKKYTKAEKQEIFSLSHPWLSILIICFRKDILKGVQKTPTLSREVLAKGIKRVLQTQNPIITVNERSIDYFREGENQSLGCIPTNSRDLPNVHPDTIPIIKAGGRAFGSFMSHKLLHYENKLIYDRWINNAYDFRKVSIEGGYSELANKLGYGKSGTTIKQIREILYFQHCFRFTLQNPDGGSKTGNLITLTEHKNSFGNVGQIEIIAGSMLTPEAVYTASKSECGKLLVPFVDLPDKMVGNPATWGAQAFLQMLISEFLTIQSRELFQRGSVRLTKEKWKELAKEVNIPESFSSRLDEIKGLFCCPDQGFLEIQGEEVTFNKKNEKAKQHLFDQGKKRETWAQKAKSKDLEKKKQEKLK
uniref:Uncharacterized protein n=1 Tax=Candidatus Kentrum sp. SD TaxID=2126332 RepID=A0A451BRM6_9GAMM|nr:MAG: hypothetical protein BECKSD772D_GA0070982_11802 [Candidatus Kentron sp. SD]